MNRAVNAFLSRHGFTQHIDINSVVDGLLYDMNNGLFGKKSDEDMIRTWTVPPKERVQNKSVLVIDAGGTNFRSCLVTFDNEGKATISDMQKTSMPGVEKELNKKDFFDKIAQNLEHLKNKASSIGFCFSYPMEITKEGDGIVTFFSKEVKAPEVVGSHIGECLSSALVEHGWERPKNILLLNDTVAALLAGAVSNTGNVYSSYIGLILGTGLNCAYLQPEIQGLEDFNESQIVVCESGKFCSIVQSDFDKILDSTTVQPGTYFMEKCSSGAYLGPISYEALKTAANEGFLSKKVSEKILELQKLTLIELDAFLHAPYNANSTLGKILFECGNKEDYEFIFLLLDSIVERSARYASSILIAAVIQTEQGKDPTKPVCILCNGTTYHKTYKVADRVKAYLEEYLTKQRRLYWEIVSVENDITLGAAIGGLIQK